MEDFVLFHIDISKMINVQVHLRLKPLFRVAVQSIFMFYA